jgi:uncharacterized membrane protein
LTYQEVPSAPLAEDPAPSRANNLVSTVEIARYPVHSMLMPFPIVCFVGAFATDLAYWRSAEIMWADFSAWLLVIGMVTGVLAAIAGLFDFFSNRLIREQALAWPLVLGSLIVLVLSFFNTLIHTRDAWTSVVPTGLILSFIVVLILFVTAWRGRSVTRYGAGVVR